MANIEGQLRAYVLSAGSVAATISSRLYYLVAPQESAFPYVVYQDVSDASSPNSFEQTSFRRPRFQFDIYGTSSAIVVEVRDMIVSALRWKTGTVGTLAVEGISIANVQTMLVEDSVIYRSIVDAIIDYQEG